MAGRKSGEAKADAGQNDLDKAMEYVKTELGELYSIALFRKVSPINSGFPILRPRWYATWLFTQGLRFEQNFKTVKLDAACRPEINFGHSR